MVSRSQPQHHDLYERLLTVVDGDTAER